MAVYENDSTMLVIFLAQGRYEILTLILSSQFHLIATTLLAQRTTKHIRKHLPLNEMPGQVTGRLAYDL